MQTTPKRTWALVLALVIASLLAPLSVAGPAGAAGSYQGAASIRSAGGGAPLTSGNFATDFTLRLPAGAACTGDTPNDAYLVTSYVIPASVDPSTLQFNASGPTPSGVGANYRQPLYLTTSQSYVSQATLDNAGSPRPKPGEVINIPDFDFELFTSAEIPAGSYNVGIACILGPASGTQMKEYWNTTVTFDAAGNWAFGSALATPVLVSVASGDGTLTATFTHAASSPASNYVATATKSATDTDCASAASPVATTPTAATTPIVMSGLVNSCDYSVTVSASNGVVWAAVSNAITGTPAPGRPAVTGLTATPGVERVDLTWSYSGPAVTGYTVTLSPVVPVTVVVTGTTAAITGLTTVRLYNFTVTPTYATAPAGTPAQVSATPNSAQAITQTISVERPVGALVLTQRCGVYGALDAESATYWPASGTGSLGALAASTDQVGIPPIWDADNFSEYPYPVDDTTGVPNAVYSTNCGVTLDRATLITSGTGAGQFFRTQGRLNQITVVDTRDTDPGWTLNGRVSEFDWATFSHNAFSGDHLGWTPKVTDDSDAFDDDLNPATVDYDQTVTAGATVAPRTTGAGGLLAGQTLASATAGGGLGVAVLDGRLKLLIPVTARNGVYTAVLTFSFI